jgi:ribosomal protein S18 acetylase RimI-like enzyme
MEDNFKYKYDSIIDKNQLVNLFNSVGWKTAEYPNRLYTAIKNSEYVMSVWNDDELIGLISAISDGAINVFITYLLVKPEYQNQGVGRIMMNDFCKHFKGYGRRILSTEIDKEAYYNKFGFVVDGIVMFNKDWENDF